MSTQDNGRRGFMRTVVGAIAAYSSSLVVSKTALADDPWECYNTCNGSEWMEGCIRYSAPCMRGGMQHLQFYVNDVGTPNECCGTFEYGQAVCEFSDSSPIC